jgi:hypothetical protein
MQACGEETGINGKSGGAGITPSMRAICRHLDEGRVRGWDVYKPIRISSFSTLFEGHHPTTLKSIPLHQTH